MQCGSLQASWRGFHKVIRVVSDGRPTPFAHYRQVEKHHRFASQLPDDVNLGAAKNTDCDRSQLVRCDVRLVYEFDICDALTAFAASIIGATLDHSKKVRAFARGDANNISDRVRWNRELGHVVKDLLSVLVVGSAQRQAGLSKSTRKVMAY